MTVIIDRSGGRDRRSGILRKRLLETGIPCAVMGQDNLFSAAEKKCVVAFDDPGKTDPFGEKVLFCDGDALASDDPAVSEREFGRIFDRITESLELRFGVRYGMHYGGLYAEDGDSSFVLGKRLRFTPTEKLVIRHLVFNPNVFLSSREIAAFTLSDIGASSVRTHAANINRKARICARFPLIVARRGSGYMYEDK